MKLKFFIGLISFIVGFGGGMVFPPAYYLSGLTAPIVFKMEKNEEPLQITVNGLPVQKQAEHIYPLTMNTLYDQEISVNGQKHFVKVDRLRKGDFIPLKVVYDDRTTFFKLHTVPETMPAYNLTKTSAKKGYILTSFHVLALNKASYAVFFDALD